MKIEYSNFNAIANLHYFIPIPSVSDWFYWYALTFYGVGYGDGGPCGRLTSAFFCSFSLSLSPPFSLFHSIFFCPTLSSSPSPPFLLRILVHLYPVPITMRMRIKKVASCRISSSNVTRRARLHSHFMSSFLLLLILARIYHSPSELS